MESSSSKLANNKRTKIGLDDTFRNIPTSVPFNKNTQIFHFTFRNEKEEWKAIMAVTATNTVER